MMATSDIKRPIPENNATTTNSPLPDFSEEAAAETAIDAETRAAFGMTGAPIHKAIRNPNPLEKSGLLRQRFNAFAWNWKIWLREPTSTIDATSVKSC
jgi:hypothetical protein